MSDTLRFDTNVPQIVALKFADGLPAESRFSGSQVMFTLTDDRRMYLPPIVADKIRDAGITAGEVFSICKREIKSGNRRTIEYQIETAAGSDATVSTPTSATRAANEAPKPAYIPPSDGNAARSLHAVAKPAPVPVPAPAPIADSAVALMKMAGCGAIDAVLEMERYAQSRGLTDFAFGADNIQKFAVTLFLEMNRKGARA